MRRRRVPPSPYPAETALALYLLVGVTSTLLLRPPRWGWILLAHFGALGIVEAIRRTPLPSLPILRGLRAMYPILLFPLLYNATGLLNRALSIWILDEPIERLELALFAGHPSLYLSEIAPWMPLSEFLHACYFSYYWLVPCLPFVLALQGRERLLAHGVYAVCLCFYVCLVFFIWLPVSSPFYKFPPIGPPLSEGFFYRLTHAVSGRGGVVGGAFPSSHVAVALLNWLFAFRWERRVFWATTIPTFGLVVATVYARYHYALDALAGVLVAILFFVLLRNPRVTETTAES